MSQQPGTWKSGGGSSGSSSSGSSGGGGCLVLILFMGILWLIHTLGSYGLK